LSATNVKVFVNRIVPPPQLQTPLDVRDWSGREVGHVDLSKHLPFASWLDRVSRATEQIMVEAVIDYGTIGAHLAKTDIVDLTPFTVANPAYTAVVDLSPPGAGSFSTGGRMVLNNRINTWFINHTTAPITPGALTFRWLLIPRVENA
jgi:hypothetical protein